MMFDKQNAICENQAFTTGTQLGTNVIDLWNAASGGTDANGNTLARDPARSPAVELEVQVTETFLDGTSETFNLVTGADGDPTLSSPTVVATTGAVLEAALVVGKRLSLRLPEGITGRYLGLQGVASGTHTAGKVSAHIIGHGGKQNAPSSFS